MQSIDLAQERISVLKYEFATKLPAMTLHYHRNLETTLTVKLFYGETDSNEFNYRLGLCAADGSTVELYWDGIETTTGFRFRRAVCLNSS